MKSSFLRGRAKHYSTRSRDHQRDRKASGEPSDPRFRQVNVAAPKRHPPPNAASPPSQETRSVSEGLTPITVYEPMLGNQGLKISIATQANRNINLETVAEGLASHDINEAPNDQALAAAEQNARQKKLGLWANPNPIAPWKWRGKDHPPLP